MCNKTIFFIIDSIHKQANLSTCLSAGSLVLGRVCYRSKAASGAFVAPQCPPTSDSPPIGNRSFAC